MLTSLVRRCALVVPLVASAAGYAQPCGLGPWREVNATSPGPRHSFQMVYDNSRGTLVIFSGAFGVFPDYTELEDTLDLVGDTWVPRPIPAPCPKRWEFAWTFDRDRNVAVLNGGASFVGVNGNPNNHHIGGTYELSGNTWTLRTFDGPVARHGAMMAYDSARRRTVLFGGKHNAPGTWEWDGTRWFDVTPVGPSPSPRGFAGFAFDERRARTVLFGGADDVFNALGETWEWDGASWQRIILAEPSVRRGLIMDYDAARGRVVIFGGTTNSGYTNEVWDYDGTVWTRLTIAGPVAPSRALFGFAFDRHRNRFVAAGGQLITGQRTDTWELLGDPYVQTPPQSQVVGAGQAAEFSVQITGALSRQLQWRHNGMPLTDDGRISGATTQVLTIEAAGPTDIGAYDVVITTACATVTTFPATLGVLCPADFNDDGGVDGADVGVFFDAWSNAEPRGDFNDDGGIDGADVSAFFERWEAGC